MSPKHSWLQQPPMKTPKKVEKCAYSDVDSTERDNSFASDKQMEVANNKAVSIALQTLDRQRVAYTTTCTHTPH